MQELTYRRAVAIAVPASIASMATPLLGAVDVWALGQSSRPLDIAAVGLGSVIFSLVYWTFGFIRMSVAGLTAQAIGGGDETSARAALLRGLIVGGAAGAFILLAQWPISQGAFSVLALDSKASAATFEAANQYFAIRIWGAPLALATYALLGWLTARGRTDLLMASTLGMTAINIALDYWFVAILDMGVFGVGLGTLIAEVAGFFFAGTACLWVMHRTGGLDAHWALHLLREPQALRRTLSVNFDIFIRTLLLAISFSWFTQRSGAFGDVMLAANQVLLQLFLFTGLALDGTAIAAETFVGQALGDKDRARGHRHLRRAIKITSWPALGAAIAFAAIYLIAGDAIVSMMTPEGPIRETAMIYLPWVIISPLVLVAPFQLDGIFIGATRAREMRNAMIVCTGFIIPATLVLTGPLGNHGLWLAFTLYFITRGTTLFAYLPRITRGTEG